MRQHLLQKAGFTLAQLHNAGNYDDNERCHLGISENILDSGSPPYIGGVDKRE